MARRSTLKSYSLAAALLILLLAQTRVAAETLNDLIVGAKKEAELSFVAGPTTFGGRQAFTELQALFNKKFASMRVLI